MFSLTSAEALPFYGLLVTVVAIIVYGYMKDYGIFWSPLTIIAIIMAYYCLLGPYEAIVSNETYDRLINMRKFYPAAFWGAWVSLLSIAAGFFMNSRSGLNVVFPRIPDEMLARYGKRVVIVSLVLFSFSTGGNIVGFINPLDADAVSTSGSFSNYFLLSINFLVPGICLLFAYWLKTRRQFAWLVVATLICVGLYLTLGFRYRIILLIGSLAITYYLAIGKRPNPILAPLLIGGLISLMGIINITRSYGSGLDTEKLEETDTEVYYKSGLRESMIFQTSGAVIATSSAKQQYVGITPIVSTLLFPIPQRFYPQKNSAAYVLTILKSIYGDKYFQGSAFMAYGEHYLSFGWWGVVGWGLLIGWLYRRIWNWFSSNKSNLWVIVAYAVTVSFAFILLSRGYLPQVTMLFFFSVFPIYFVMGIVRRRFAFRVVSRPAPRVQS